jgi:hypothetical protein
VQLNQKDELLLAKGNNGLSTWIFAGNDGNKEILETLRVWVEKWN